jgi:hypothetical protein
VSQTNIPYFKSWIIFMITSFVLSVLAGMAIGFVVGFIMGMIGAPMQTVQVVCAIAGGVLGLIVSYAMFRWVIDRFIIPSVAGATSTLS